MNREDIDVIKELVDELNFARQFLENSDYKKVKEELKNLSQKIENLELKFDEQYFKKLEKELNEKARDFAESLKRDIELYQKAKEELEESKKYYLNVLNEIKKETKKAVRNTYIFNKVNLITTLIIFFIVGIAGYFFGCHHLLFFK